MNIVYDYIKSINFKENSNIVVAVSGGPDSMCLLSILLELRDELNYNIICAHVNHSKRIQSFEEEEYVKSFCYKNDIIFEYLKIDNYNDNINFHEQAREKRYNFFDELIKKYKSKYLFLAHHGDDLIETILMRITRGSDIVGYSGFRKMQARKNYYLVRPLIYITKDDIIKYLEDNNIKYYIDSSNASDVYTRNRYRKYILPFLKSENKNIHRKYIEFSNVLYKQEEYINKIVNTKYLEYVTSDVLNLNKFINEEIIIQERIIYNMLSDIYGDDIKNINKKHIKEMLSIINSDRPNVSIDLPGEYSAIKDYDKFYITHNENIDNNYKYMLVDEVELDNYIIKIDNKCNDTSNYTIRLDSNEISLPLYIRNRKDGDTIEVKGLNGTKKIKDIMIDSKVPIKKRNEIPILVDKTGKILCVFGIKKSKYDKQINDFCDIIVKCIEKKEENYEK